MSYGELCGVWLTKHVTSPHRDRVKVFMLLSDGIRGKRRNITRRENLGVVDCTMIGLKVQGF